MFTWMNLEIWGLQKKATKFFIIAYLACDVPIHLRTAMSRLLRKLHKKGAYHPKQNELKFCKMNDYCRKTVLDEVIKTDANIGVIIVEKRFVRADLREKLPILYNYLVVHNIVSNLLPNLEAGQQIHMVFDKSLPKARIRKFNHYIKEKASFLFFERGNSLNPNLIISNHIDSKIEPCLQAVDSIAGAYFQKFENSNCSYFEIIKDYSSFYYRWKR